jgi:carbon-monoxide dehydrogenase medium subunit
VKPARFDYARPASLDDAIGLLGTEDVFAKALAGGQSLGPMLNLRLVQPELLVDISRLPELAEVGEENEGLTLGAGITHAAIEDRRVPDVTAGMLPRVAGQIAFRAVRNRGTLGGSLAHGDPAADWVTCLAALGAEVVIRGRAGRRQVAVADLMRGAFETGLEADELLTAIRVPRLAGGARWGYYKVCRKIGELAEAVAAVVHDPERGVYRAVVGATHGSPIVIAEARDAGAAAEVMAAAAQGFDDYETQVHEVALRRAFQALEQG